MAAIGGYKTRQRELILDCLSQNIHRHITVDEAADFLRDQGDPVGKTTIYRYLEKLVGESMARKFILPAGGGTCYQLISQEETCHSHFHLICIDCGNLIHLECRFLDEITHHVLQEHRFTLNSSRTVFYGQCECCQASH